MTRVLSYIFRDNRPSTFFEIIGLFFKFTFEFGKIIPVQFFESDFAALTKTQAYVCRDTRIVPNTE